MTVPEKYKANYENLFATCIIKANKYPAIDAIVDAIIANKKRYKKVGQPLNIPWFVIGIIHNMECSLNFKGHLHNGDPLTARTVHVPAHRPAAGKPPFTWEESALDALTLDKLNEWGNWTISGTLYKLEGFNGMGYYAKGINSPYLWSFSNHYTKGKFVADGHYDPNAVSQQIGAAVLLRRLRERQEITFPDGNALDQLKAIGEKSGTYAPDTYSEQAEMLQILLNGLGAVLRVDGQAGPRTSNEYKKLTNKYLKGDPRRRDK